MLLKAGITKTPDRNQRPYITTAPPPFTDRPAENILHHHSSSDDCHVLKARSNTLNARMSSPKPNLSLGISVGPSFFFAVPPGLLLPERVLMSLRSAIGHPCRRCIIITITIMLRALLLQRLRWGRRSRVGDDVLALVLR